MVSLVMNTCPTPKETSPCPDSDDEWIEGVEAAIRSLDDGAFIPHEDVRRWVQSWDTPDEIPPPRG